MYRNKYQDARMNQIPSVRVIGKSEVPKEKQLEAKKMLLETLKENGIVGDDATIENTFKDIERLIGD
ncbi:MAG: hypothetical protein Q4C49_10760 [Bacillota bacterium]|nr:hypothetical protein [Bacillota bacterium]